MNPFELTRAMEIGVRLQGGFKELNCPSSPFQMTLVSPGDVVIHPETHYPLLSFNLWLEEKNPQLRKVEVHYRIAADGARIRDGMVAIEPKEIYQVFLGAGK